MDHLPSPAQLLHATPNWVFGLFLLLLWIGLRQLSASRPHVLRATLVPLGLAGLSCYGAVNTLGQSPTALAAWALAAAACLWLVLRRPVPPGIRYQAGESRFEMPGSAVPLVLMMGVFFTKFLVGVGMGMHAEWRNEPDLLLPIGLVYGMFSGVFAGRGARLLMLAQRSRRAGLVA